MRDVANAQADKIVAAKLAVNGQVEHGKIANGMRTLAVDADRPDVFVGKVSIAAEGAGEAGRSITQIREGSGCVVGVSDDISSALKEQRTAGDSSGLGDMTEVLGGADELALLIALALAAALLFAGGWIVCSAPLLFAGLLVDGVLAASLYRCLAGAEPRHWLETAFRRTVWPFAATAVLHRGRHDARPGAGGPVDQRC